MNRIYVTDLDHTFLRSDLSVSNFTRKIWNAKAREATLTIATARSFYAAMKYLPGLTFNAPMILLDGTLIATPERKIIDAKFLDTAAANDLIAEAIRFDKIHPFVIGLKNDNLDESFDFPLTKTPTQEKVLLNYRDDTRLMEFDQIVAKEQTFKVVYMASKERLVALTEHLEGIYGATFHFKLSPENYTGDYFLTILHPLGDKAHALKKVCDLLGRPLEDVTVFGDSINDIGMFRLAGMSAAVANALEETKAVAKTVLPHSNDEDAVAKYLQTTMK
ncbi:MAG: HAD family hydrolase [Thiovulaceae bacterium]|nr:HAD family hydrolase [Sulfurimonadaceae bacterium]